MYHYSPSIFIRLLIIFFILLVSSTAFYSLYRDLRGQLHIRQAEHEALASRFDSAAAEFHQAETYLPNDYFIQSALGNAYFRLGTEADKSSQRVLFLNRAKHYFNKALELNPLDARSAYGRARTEIRLERYYALAGESGTGNVKTDALPALEKAISLRPASTIYRLAMVRYLYMHDMGERLLSEVQVIGRLQPGDLQTLKREPFWSAAVREAFKQGVREALEHGVTPRQSLFALSDILAEEENYSEAISSRIRGMEVQRSLNSSGDYIRLGYLYLLEDQLSPALEYFSRSLEHSEDIESDIIRIMRTCSRAENPQALVDFYREAAEKYGASTATDLSGAQMLIDLQDLENARTILLDTNARKETAEAYFQLMRIAEKEQDWDGAELAIQKAVMHKPENGNYRLIFSQVLNRLQKYEQAEKEATLAMQSIENISAGLFDYRALLRMKTGNYEGALEDWQQAIKADPENGTYYFHAAGAEYELANIELARELYRKAVELQPGNRAFSLALERLEKKYGTQE